MSTLSIGVLALGLVLASCGSDRIEQSQRQAADVSAAQVQQALPESSEVHARVDALRERFRVSGSDVLRSRARTPTRPAATPLLRPVLGDGLVARFETSTTNADSHVRVVVATDAKRGVARTATVALPLSATGAVKLTDDSSQVAVAFSLTGTQAVKVAVSGGIALYAKAYGGEADVVHRVHAEGTEDYVVFEERPAIEELRYAVDVSRVAGLRLVSNTLEFLDETGTPRLRVAPPYIADASGQRQEAKLAVDGCAYDANAAAPWGRAVTRPGAPSCSVRVTWSDMIYPALVDPAWTATGSMATRRFNHTATLLPSGNVLMAGGENDFRLSSAELYDPTGAGTFAATGSMAFARTWHTATLLNSGKVLLAAGVDNTQSLSSAEVYDPTGGSFQATGSMATVRWLTTATLLPSGKVLVAGGCGPGGICIAVASSELYDPTGAGSFAPTAAMATPREGHTATLLASGKVLIAGGNNAVRTEQSAEVFDAAGTGSFTTTGSMTQPRGAHTAMILPRSVDSLFTLPASVYSSLD